MKGVCSNWLPDTGWKDITSRQGHLVTCMRADITMNTLRESTCNTRKGETGNRVVAREKQMPALTAPKHRIFKKDTCAKRSMFRGLATVQDDVTVQQNNLLRCHEHGNVDRTAMTGRCWKRGREALAAELPSRIAALCVLNKNPLPVRLLCRMEVVLCDVLEARYRIAQRSWKRWHDQVARTLPTHAARVTKPCCL